jgi:hypothetical protein
LKHIRKSCGLDIAKEKQRKHGGEETLDSEPPVLFELYEQDWSHLQGAVRSMEICYSFLKKVEAFEAVFRDRVCLFKKKNDLLKNQR